MNADTILNVWCNCYIIFNLQGPQNFRTAVRRSKEQHNQRKIPMRSSPLYYVGRGPSAHWIGFLQPPNTFHSLLQGRTTEISTNSCKKERHLGMVAYELQKFPRSQAVGTLQTCAFFGHQQEVDEEIFGVLLDSTILWVCLIYFWRLHWFYGGGLQRCVFWGADWAACTYSHFTHHVPWHSCPCGYQRNKCLCDWWCRMRK